MKGNCAIYGIQSVSASCHELEKICLEEERRPGKEELKDVEDSWSAFAERVRLFADQGEENIVEVQHPELEVLIKNAKARMPHLKLVEQLEALKHEPTEIRFGRIGEQAKRLAKQLGKGTVTIEIEGNHVRLPAEKWADFWSTFVHVVRNALDHGIETPAERLAAGKPETGTIRLLSKVDGSCFVIEMTDDGRGVNWDKVQEKAQAAGMPHESREDLIAAIFSDGLSTRDEATTMSGRGVGMSAVKQACDEMNGTVTMSSIAGGGTTVRFRLPTSGNDQLSPMSVRGGIRPSIAPAPPSSSKLTFKAG